MEEAQEYDERNTGQGQEHRKEKTCVTYYFFLSPKGTFKIN